MAKKAKGRADAKTPTQGAIVQAQVDLGVGPDVPSYYINYADMSQSTHEFTLTVGKMPTRLTAEATREVQATGRIHVDAILQLVIPPTLLPSLIKALTIQKDAYEQTFGPIRDATEFVKTMSTLQ